MARPAQNSWPKYGTSAPLTVIVRAGQRLGVVVGERGRRRDRGQQHVVVLEERPPCPALRIPCLGGDDDVAVAGGRVAQALGVRRCRRRARVARPARPCGRSPGSRALSVAISSCRYVAWASPTSIVGRASDVDRRRRPRRGRRAAASIGAGDGVVDRSQVGLVEPHGDPQAGERPRRRRQRQPVAVLEVGPGGHLEGEREVLGRAGQRPDHGDRPLADEQLAQASAPAWARCRTSACARTRRCTRPGCGCCRRCRCRTRGPSGRRRGRPPNHPTIRRRPG